MSATSTNHLQWASLDFLTDVNQLQIYQDESGIDNLLLLRFETSADMLPKILASLGIKQPLRPGYRPMPERSSGGPSWWRPYNRDEFQGAQGIANGLGREIIVYDNPGNGKEIYLRTYQL